MCTAANTLEKEATCGIETTQPHVVLETYKRPSTNQHTLNTTPSPPLLNYDIHKQQNKQKYT